MPIEFQNPIFLVLLILPILFLFRHRFRKRETSVYFPWANRMPRYTSIHAWLATRFMDLLTAATMVLLVLALARPQINHREIERLTEGVDIILTMDTSDSMRALDFIVNGERVDRLTVVKQVATEFARSREDDRIGVVVFGEDAFTQCPPTLDHAVLRRFMDWINIGMVGQGTALGSAIAVAVKRLASLPSKSKVIILITDGKETVRYVDPLKAAKMAKALGIKIYTVGVGSNEPVPFPIRGFFGDKVVLRRVELDENMLREIAEMTGGIYFNARDTSSLREVTKQIDQMEKTEILTREYKDTEEKYAAFTWPALWLLLAMAILRNTILRRLP